MKKILLLMMAVVTLEFVTSAQNNGVYMPKDVARSLHNQPAPDLQVAEWVSDEPDMRGKFVVVEFWGVKCNPCKGSIPHLNKLSKKYKKEAVFMGLAYDTAEKVKAMKEPKMDFYNAVDPEKRLMNKLGLFFVPYTMIIDPQGLVCWTGMPTDLTEEVMDSLITARGYTLDLELRQVDVTKQRIPLNSFLGKKAPELVVKAWNTEKPAMEGKFILYEITGLMCPPCWRAVPKLNAIHEQYKDQVVVIGVKDVKGKMPQEPEAHYYTGIDPERSVYKAIGLRSVPYALLVDPDGIVRWEGSPNDLDCVVVGKIIKKYGK